MDILSFRFLCNDWNQLIVQWWISFLMLLVEERMIWISNGRDVRVSVCVMRYNACYYLQVYEILCVFQALICMGILCYIIHIYIGYLVHARVEHAFYSFVSIIKITMSCLDSSLMTIRYLSLLTVWSTDSHPGQSHWIRSSPACFSLKCCFKLDAFV